MKNVKLAMLMALALAAQSVALGATPKVKALSTPEDPSQKTVLVGRAAAAGMAIVFEIEAAKSMWMSMGTPPRWKEHAPGATEKFHLEVKPTDQKSNTRVSYADVKLTAVNTDNGKKVQGKLHPMWGGSGLHYAMNSALAGDGTYAVQVTIGAPSFGRAPADKNLWIAPVTAQFHFKLKDSKLVEVSEPDN
jgi:uncharacterized protein involved in high-affinity Fe2+ transport